MKFRDLQKFLNERITDKLEWLDGDDFHIAVYGPHKEFELYVSEGKVWFDKYGRNQLVPMSYGQYLKYLYELNEWEDMPGGIENIEGED